MTTITYIVGDRFNSFAQRDNVLTVVQVFKMLEQGDKSLKEKLFVIGQGISQIERTELKLLSRKKYLGPIVNIHQAMASKQLTHKHQTQNIMITDPLIIEPKKSFRSYLVTDDACAEMSDHLTGQHIQGMVLTEAARQMMLAVAEKYILKPEEKGESYCVLNSINSSFYQFAFPIDIKIEHEILSLQNNKSANYSISTRTSFIQHNTVIAHVDISYVLNHKTLLGRCEKQSADRVLRLNQEEHSNYSYLLDMSA